jgi:hypothetical protein
MTKSQLLSFVDNLSAIDPLVLAKDSIPKGAIPLLCQYLSIKVRLFADVKKEYLIQSDYSVRYNSRFKETGLVYVNNNPRIDSIGIYKVPGKRTKYDTSENIHEFIRLDVPVGHEKSLLIDGGYSYFVNVFTSKPDMYQSLTRALKTEDLDCQWFYQLDTIETAGLTINDYMHVSGDSLMAVFVPPASSKITTFTVWSQVYDVMKNVINAPKGSSLIEGRGRFEYTPAYLKSIKK